MTIEKSNSYDTPTEVIDLIIRQSLECSKELSLQPDMNINAILLDQEILEKRKQERFELMYIVEGLKGLLKNNMRAIDRFIATDEEGYVVFVESQKGVVAPSIAPGCCLTCDRIGSNAIGLALKHRVSMRVRGDEHYLTALYPCISVGIPIVRNHKVLGCIGVFISVSDNNRFQPGIIEYIIETAISSSSKMLETQKYMDELYLLKEFFNNLDNKQGILVIASNHKILQVNQEAESLLGIDKNEILGNSLENFVEGDWLTLKSRQKTQKIDNIFFATSHGKVELMATLAPVIDSKSRLLGWNLRIESPGSCQSITSRRSRFEFKDIIGQNKDFVRLIKLSRAVAPSPSNVLITGESGTGKELFAQAIHYASYCKNGPFIAINCAAIPRELIETELFGYVEGAFTGARRGGMQGKFVQANGGTLFLDEIGDMPIELQSKLLRVLQDRLVMPVGGSKEIPINIRLISATNQNLEESIAQGNFRADLYYRLNVINLRLPSLRERKDDIDLLVNHFAGTYAEKLNKTILDISPEAREQLRTYDWPGNIRELENVVEMAVNLAGDVIEVQHLRANVLHHTKPKERLCACEIEPTDEIVSLEEVEKIQIIKALNRYGGNISHTANVLEIGRTTLYRKIKKYDLLQYVKQ